MCPALCGPTSPGLPFLKSCAAIASNPKQWSPTADALWSVVIRAVREDQRMDAPTLMAMNRLRG